MQISEAARGHAAALAGDRPQSAARAACGPAAGCRAESGRDLDRDAAGRVFAAQIVEHLAVAGTARVDQSGIQTARRHVAAADGAAGVAKALRSAVAHSGTSAEQAVPGLLQQVDAGIANAEATLERMGYEPEQVAAAAVHFRERVGALLGAYAGQPEAPVEAAQVSVTHVRKERGRIELVTQDGDVVRIGFRSRESERVAVAGAQGADGNALRARIATEQSAQLRMAVHGELDASERKAIEDFLTTVDTFATQFYDGDAGAAFAAAAVMQIDAEQIAHYAVKLSLSERYDVRARVQPEAQSPGRLPVLQPAAGAAATGAPAPAGNPALAAAAAAPSATGLVAQALPVPEPVSIPAATETRTSARDTPAGVSGLDTIRAFVRGVLAAAQKPLSVYGNALELQVKIELTEALLEAARPDAQSRPGAVLLGAVLSRAAAVAQEIKAAAAL